MNFNFNHSKTRIMAMFYFMKEENEKSLKKILIHSSVVIESFFCLIKYRILLLDKNKLIDNTALQTLEHVQNLNQHCQISSFLPEAKYWS